MSYLSAVIVGAFLAIPLYRPILIAAHLVPVLYAVFAATAGFQLLHARIAARAGLPGVLLLLFVALMIFATAVAAQQVRIGTIGLLFFLPISYLLGLTVCASGQIDKVMKTILVIFVPVAIYILYQLSRNGFSYSTYMNWSSAAYKVDYLNFSLYGVVLFIYYATRNTSLGKRAILSGFLLFTVLISGARYSILFALAFLFFIAIAGMQTRNLRRAPLFWLVGVMAVVLVLGGVIRPETYYRFFEYSVFRMTSVLSVDQSIAGRLALISESLAGGLQHFLLGRGVGGSAEILQGSYPHNYILEAFLDGGLFAMMALIAFSAAAILQPLRYVPRDQRWVIALVLFIAGAFLKSFSIYESRMLFFTLGYLFGYYAYRSQRKYSSLVNRSKTVAFR